jgi:hypothetical protein
MKKLLSVFTILLVVILLSGISFAQQWSDAQKDVWTGVEKYWDVDNAQTFLTYFDLIDPWFLKAKQIQLNGLKTI